MAVKTERETLYRCVTVYSVPLPSRYCCIYCRCVRCLLAEPRVLLTLFLYVHVLLTCNEVRLCLVLWHLAAVWRSVASCCHGTESAYLCICVSRLKKLWWNLDEIYRANTSLLLLLFIGRLVLGPWRPNLEQQSLEVFEEDVRYLTSPTAGVDK